MKLFIFQISKWETLTFTVFAKKHTKMASLWLNVGNAMDGSMEGLYDFVLWHDEMCIIVSCVVCWFESMGPTLSETCLQMMGNFDKILGGWEPCFCRWWVILMRSWSPVCRWWVILMRSSQEHLLQNFRSTKLQEYSWHFILPRQEQ